MDEIGERTRSEIKGLREEIVARDSKIESIMKYKEKEDSFVAEIKRLKEELDREKTDKEHVVKGKERQMFEATESLKKDMLKRIKETKANLMALNDEQLHATTRLTILQNHQLTTELEYQSKQTEKLLLKNTKLEEQIGALRRDVEIHKQVETELAKRSHLCQKVIKKLNEKVRTLEDQKDGEQPAAKGEAEGKSKTKEGSDELITFLESKLEEAEKKYAAFHNDYEILHADYVKQQQMLDKMKDKYSKAALLLTEFLDNLLTSTPNLLQEEKNLYLDIERLYIPD